MSTCPSCSAETTDGARFCMACGQPLAAAPPCAACGAELAPEARFCTECGARVALGSPDRPGAVVDGAWHRPPGELARRIEPDAMRSAFAKLLPLLARTITVPAGSVGVTMLDGACSRVLPPGEQTAVDWLKDPLWTADRRTFHLVDLRPVPLRFTWPEVRAQVLLSVGSSPERLGRFINDVVRDADALTAQTLHARYRADVEQALQDALAATGGDLGRAQRQAEQALEARFGAATGLSFEVRLAQQHTDQRHDMQLEGPITSDAEPIELDLTLTVKGPRTPELPRAQLTAAAQRHARAHTLAELSTPEGVEALQQVLEAVAAEVLKEAHGGLALVDLRSVGGAWALAARAELARARAEVQLGREELAVDTDRAALEAEVQAVARRREELARELEAQRRTAAHTDAMDAGAEAHERAVQAAAQRDELAARARARQSEEHRQRAEDDAFADQKRREARLAELSAMAKLEAGISEREHRQKLDTVAAMAGRSEAEILALQATELADKQHGGAFAEALGKLADRGEARDQRVAEAYREAASAAKELAQTAMESHAKVAASRACPGCRTELPEGARFCKTCGTPTA